MPRGTISRFATTVLGKRSMSRFTKDPVRLVLRNCFYVGELPDGNGGWVPGKHEALTGPATFDAVQTARERNTRKPYRVSEVRIPWALSGVGVCVCGASMVVNGRPSRRRSLRCAGRIQGRSCKQPSFYEDVLNEQVTRDILAKFAVGYEEQERLVAA